MNKYLIVFKNTHDAMDAESKFNESNKKVIVMPTPTQITHSCGICIILTEDNYEEASKIIEKNQIKYKNIYSVKDNSIELIK